VSKGSAFKRSDVNSTGHPESYQDALLLPFCCDRSKDLGLSAFSDVRIIVMLAHNLGLKVVAEGAETSEQVSLLRQLECELVQGYFFARPGDHAAAQSLLAGTARTAADPLLR
jgi:predicted signal transduction protein with EAL and GGDEF domain